MIAATDSDRGLEEVAEKIELVREKHKSFSISAQRDLKEIIRMQDIVPKKLDKRKLMQIYMSIQ